jgi:predicted peptidase
MRIITLGICCLYFVHTLAQDIKLFENKEYIRDQDTLKYRILYPQEMQEHKQYPLVLFLHGAGERGNDNERQLTHGASLFLTAENRKKYPAIILFPQCPQNIMWTHRLKQKTEEGIWEFEFPLQSTPTQPAALVNQLVNELLESGSIDKRRVYIMGLSMGGIGTLDFLCRWPDKYAAAAVICGGHNPEFSSYYKNVPIWFFHGAKDDVVPHIYSQEVYNELQKQNADVKYTLYPKANHNSWDAAFAEPDYLEWFFKHKKKK